MPVESITCMTTFMIIRTVLCFFNSKKSISRVKEHNDFKQWIDKVTLELNQAIFHLKLINFYYILKESLMWILYQKIKKYMHYPLV